MSEHYHLVGVAGVGMSALAQALLGDGRSVSGSDRYCDDGAKSAITTKLALAGVVLLPQDGSGVSDCTTAVVVSTAIEGDNPDIIAAEKLGVPVVHRSQALADLTAGKRTVAVTGTSGKSTVTGMIGWILSELDADPTVVNGAPIINWDSDQCIGNVRSGKSDLWVIEADESDRSLLNYSPEWVLVTNASEDHFSMSETLSLFDQFSRSARVGVVSSVSDPLIMDQFSPELSFSGSEFIYDDVSFRVLLPGRHNAENALLAVILCSRLGFDLKEISVALAKFKGIKRRLEVIGHASGVTVVDEYAHNPAKIRAAWQTVAAYHERMIVVWRPHGYGPLKTMMDGLEETFVELSAKADKVFVMSVYDAGGTADRSIQSDVLVERLCERGIDAQYIDTAENLTHEVLNVVRTGDAVLVMGARDPGLSGLAREILKKLVL
ncbi:MAG: hypothetical protein KAH23_07100 [Kiritimatiellae bacterium]|nr:hypothetical protein [Kiritimatiellia bacterium]